MNWYHLCDIFLNPLNRRLITDLLPWNLCCQFPHG